MKYSKKIILAILLFNGIFAGAQQTNLYDSQGRLRIDTSFHVEKSILEHICYLEEHVLYSVYEAIEYPNLACQNGIGGVVIAKVRVIKGKLETSCKVVKSPDPLLSKAVKHAFFKNSLRLAKASKSNETIEFYVPFEFEIDGSNFMEQLRENRLIKIEKNYLKGPMKLL